MAINTKSIKGAPNAFEYSSGVIDLAVGETFNSDNLLATTNSTGMTFIVDILDQAVLGDVKYKMQMTCGTTQEINSNFIEGGGATDYTPWHDWNVDGMDVDGYVEDVQFDWWIPIPSGVRMIFVNEGASAAKVYWAVRGQ